MRPPTKLPSPRGIPWDAGGAPGPRARLPDRSCPFPTAPPTGGPPVAASLPDANTRWRCAACGNLTRFDVTRTRRTTEFWHFDLAGDHRVEETTTEAADV